jgi:hypothetical protein
LTTPIKAPFDAYTPFPDPLCQESIRLLVQSRRRKGSTFEQRKIAGKLGNDANLVPILQILPYAG